MPAPARSRRRRDNARLSKARARNGGVQRARTKWRRATRLHKMAARHALARNGGVQRPRVSRAAKERVACLQALVSDDGIWGNLQSFASRGALPGHLCPLHVTPHPPWLLARRRRLSQRPGGVQSNFAALNTRVAFLDFQLKVLRP